MRSATDEPLAAAYRALYPRFLGYAHRCLGGRAGDVGPDRAVEPADVVGACVVRVYAKIAAGAYRAEDFRPIVMRAIRNEVSDCRAAARRRQLAVQREGVGSPLEAPDPPEPTGEVARDVAAAARRVLAGSDPRHRERDRAVLRTLLESEEPWGHGLRELAGRLDVPLPAVKSRMKRVRDRLAAELGGASGWRAL